MGITRADWLCAALWATVLAVTYAAWVALVARLCGA